MGKRKSILIICDHDFPLPPAKGGAPEELIWDGLIKINESVDDPINITCLTLYDKKAKEMGKDFKNTTFLYFKYSLMVKLIHKIMVFGFWVLQKLKIWRHPIPSMKIKWLIKYLKKFLRKSSYDELVFEEAPTPLMAYMNQEAMKKYEGHAWYHQHSKHSLPISHHSSYLSLKGIICVSDFLATTVEEKNGQKPRTYVLRNFVDSTLFYPKPKSKELMDKYGLSDSDFVVMFAGRLLEIKGPDKLILAFKEVLKEMPNAKLLIAGGNYLKTKEGDAYEMKLRKLSNDIKDKVIFTGYINHVDLVDYYALADLACLPSVWQEPAGLTMLEAMACGKALITTKSGGIPEYVGEGNAIFLPLNDELIPNIAKSIIHLEKHPEEMESLSKKGLERVKLFTKEKFHKGFIDIVLDGQKDVR